MVRAILFLLTVVAVCSPSWSQISRFDNSNRPPPHAPNSYDVDRREYGDETGQGLLFSCPESDRPRPLFLQFETASWEDGLYSNGDGYLPPFVMEQGYCYANVGGRYGEQVDETLADFFAALSYLRENADELRHDPDRIVLSARGNGASLVALLSTAPEYFLASGIDFSVIRGVVLIEPDALDVEARAEQSRRLRNNYFPDFFGEDRSRWGDYSATAHLTPPNAPRFFLVGRSNRPTYADIAAEFARELDRHGIENEMVRLRRFRELGSPQRLTDDPEEPTNMLAEFLERAATGE